MVDNQHQKITGYRDLTEDEIAAGVAVVPAVSRLQAAIDAVVAAERERKRLDDSYMATGKTLEHASCEYYRAKHALHELVEEMLEERREEKAREGEGSVCSSAL